MQNRASLITGVVLGLCVLIASVILLMWSMHTSSTCLQTTDVQLKDNVKLRGCVMPSVLRDPPFSFKFLGKPYLQTRYRAIRAGYDGQRQAIRERDRNIEPKIGKTVVSKTFTRQAATRTVCCFLTRALTEAYVATVNALVPADNSIPTFVFVDSDNVPEHVLHAGIWVIAVPEAHCKAAGFVDLNYFKPVCAWAKCLYTLVQQFRNVFGYPVAFGNAWIFEDDCRFGSVNKFRSLVLDTDPEPELVVTHLAQLDPSNTSWENWHYAKAYFAEGVPLYKSFNAYMRIGQRLLDACGQIAERYKHLAFLEVFFATVAAANDLPVLELAMLHPYTRAFPNEPGFEALVEAHLPCIAHPFKSHAENLQALLSHSQQPV